MHEDGCIQYTFFVRFSVFFANIKKFSRLDILMMRHSIVVQKSDFIPVALRGVKKCEAAYPECRNRQHLGTNQWKSALRSRRTSIPRRGEINPPTNQVPIESVCVFCRQKRAKRFLLTKLVVCTTRYVAPYRYTSVR